MIVLQYLQAANFILEVAVDKFHLHFIKVIKVSQDFVNFNINLR